MKILILYYSPTKNTQYIANKFKSAFENFDLKVENENTEKNKIIVDEIDLTKENNIDLSNYDYVGLGYPIHAFNPPKAFYKIVKNLTFLQNQKVFIFKTSGEPHPFNNASSTRILRVLKRKKVKVISDIHFLMPYYIMFRHSDELVKKMLVTNDALVKVYVKGLLQGKTYFVKSNIFCNLASDIFRIEWGGASILGRKFVSKDCCDGCGICVKNCPQNNITIKDGVATHRKNCNICMSCVAFCPKNAVNTRYMEKWKVNGKYDFDSIKNNQNISDDYLKTTREFLGIYENYFKKQDEIIKEYGQESCK